MSYAKKRRPTVVVPNSPVSFAIMGASELHRHVLIRSDDHNLDLIGLDDGNFRSHFDIEFVENFNIFSGFLIPEPRPFIVRTFAEDAQPVSNVDARTSHFSFAWRGLASRYDLMEIEKIFSMMAADLTAALEEDTSESAEWQVAPLVALCQRKTNSHIRQRKRRRFAIISASIIYGLIAVIFAFNLPFLFDRFEH